MSTGRRYHTLVPEPIRPRVDRAIIEMRRRRVSYRATAEALDVFTGLRLTEHHIKQRARKLGLPADDPRGGARS
jgi:hypothetical protein